MKILKKIKNYFLYKSLNIAYVLDNCDNQDVVYFLNKQLSKFQFTNSYENTDVLIVSANFNTVLEEEFLYFVKPKLPKHCVVICLGNPQNVNILKNLAYYIIVEKDKIIEDINSSILHAKDLIRNDFKRVF
jgi:hypothetical protein